MYLVSNRRQRYNYDNLSLLRGFGASDSQFVILIVDLYWLVTITTEK